jgi:TolB-like protein
VLVAVLGVSIFQVVRDSSSGETEDAASAAADAAARAQPGPPPPAEPVADASIAVLPFANLSSDPDQEYFSDGLAEELMTKLARFDGLQVAARTSSFAFKERSESSGEIGRRLGVAHLLEGSVRRSGTELRVTARLFNAQTGYELWAERFDSELVDVFAIQEEIATAVARALSVALRVGEITRIAGGTTNVEAYDQYLKGIALLNRGTPPGDLILASEHLRAALEADPGFSIARATRALTLARILIFVPEQSNETRTELDDEVATALASAPDHWSGHIASVIVASGRRDWLAADAALRRIRELEAPDWSAATSLAVVLASMGRHDDAIRDLREARRKDPLSIDIAGILQQNLFVVGRVAEARADYEATLDLPGQRDSIEHIALMSIWDSGDRSRVEAQFRRFLEYQTVPMPVLEDVADVLDDPPAARALLARAFADAGYQDPTRLMILAWHAAHFGDDALAGAALRRAFVDMNGVFVPAIWFPQLARYRQTPEFKALVRDLKLVEYWRESGNWGDHCRPVGSDDFECN